jgi:cysteine desulfuration protein SufE
MSNNPASRPPALDKLVQKLKRQSDPKRRYELLIWLAQKLEPLPEASKVPDNRVQGCVSQVFISATLEDGKIFYRGDSDSQLVKGLVALLVQGLSGLPSQEIMEVNPDFIQETGLNVSLTPSRANGFYNIFQMMKQKAAMLNEAAAV